MGKVTPTKITCLSSLYLGIEVNFIENLEQDKFFEINSKCSDLEAIKGFGGLNFDKSGRW